MRIPERGTSREEVLAKLAELRAGDVDWREGKAFTDVFRPGEEATTLVEEANRALLWENGLDPASYPSLLRLETEIVAMAASHLGGDEEVVGNFTSGGTESVLLAVKTARDHARATRPEIDRPEIVLPVTAHPCFHKAAHLFGLDAVVTPVDPRTFRADPDAMRAAVTPRTVLLVASAPSYAHGVVDPVEPIAAIARERGILLHVDGCIGGFLLPLLRELGAPVPAFDFTVPGVSSMSMDFHKYAFAAKGASVVLYRDARLRRHQIFAWSGWPGYSLVNPTLQSTKSGGPLAATWAVLHHLGRDGYRREAARLREATARVVAGVEATPDVEVLGRPDMTLVAIGSDRLSVFQLAEAMEQRGWHVYPQLRAGELRESLHLTVLPANAERVGDWLTDLRACIDEVRDKPPSATLRTLRDLLAQVDLEKLDDAQIDELLGQVGLGTGELPGSRADLNEILNALPPRVRDRLLVAYFNELYR